MPLPREAHYTSEDYWNLPEGQRAELIDGRLYDMAPPYRIHQELVSGFRVLEYWIVNPAQRTVNVYDFSSEDSEATGQYSFDDIIAVNIFPGFSIKVSDLL